jgi:hypothetical protein
LTVTDEEFPDRKLPQTLQRQQRRGLDILWTPRNLRACTKFLPTRKRYPDAVIVTVDDDVIYPSWLLAGLLREHEVAPGTIVGHRGAWVKLAGPRELRSYVEFLPASPETPSNRVLLTGVGGTLYPPGSLSEAVHDYETACRLAPYTTTFGITSWRC